MIVSFTLSRANTYIVPTYKYAVKHNINIININEDYHSNRLGTKFVSTYLLKV